MESDDYSSMTDYQFFGLVSAFLEKKAVYSPAVNELLARVRNPYEGMKCKASEGEAKARMFRFTTLLSNGQVLDLCEKPLGELEKSLREELVRRIHGENGFRPFSHLANVWFNEWEQIYLH